jgi:hypothetical protein
METTKLFLTQKGIDNLIEQYPELKGLSRDEIIEWCNKNLKLFYEE